MRYCKILSWIVVIFWMAFIFKMSSQPAVQSWKLSSEVTDVGIKAIEKVIPNTKFNSKEFNDIVRKCAHFFLYFFLGIIIISVLRRCGIHGILRIFFAILICIFYAISDEIHQIFVLGRRAEVKDVIIDSVGVLVGIGVYLTMRRKWYK